MAAISGMIGSVTFAAGYTSNAHAWEADVTAEALITTGFSPTNNYQTRLVGLLDWSGSYTCWTDGTTALPTPGVTGSATFVATTSRQYSGTIQVTSARTGISADGSQRTCTVSWVGAGAATPA